ncbi:MAG: hypothetical protein HRU70_05935 [Phycisphaeraceae bacterium]|nr:MAG: hypothetical protein HRU70_05935 [Phycisphaeraceae bacterium]
MKIEGRWLAAGVLIAGGAVMMAMSASWYNTCSGLTHDNNSTCSAEPCKRCCQVCCTHFNGGSWDAVCASLKCSQLPAVCPAPPAP